MMKQPSNTRKILTEVSLAIKKKRVGDQKELAIINDNNDASTSQISRLSTLSPNEEGTPRPSVSFNPNRGVHLHYDTCGLFAEADRTSSTMYAGMDNNSVRVLIWDDHNENNLCREGHIALIIRKNKTFNYTSFYYDKEGKTTFRKNFAEDYFSSRNKSHPDYVIDISFSQTEIEKMLEKQKFYLDNQDKLIGKTYAGCCPGYQYQNCTTICYNILALGNIDSILYRKPKEQRIASYWRTAILLGFLYIAYLVIAILLLEVFDLLVLGDEINLAEEFLFAILLSLITGCLTCCSTIIYFMCSEGQQTIRLKSAPTDFKERLIQAATFSNKRFSHKEHYEYYVTNNFRALQQKLGQPREAVIIFEKTNDQWIMRYYYDVLAIQQQERGITQKKDYTTLDKIFAESQNNNALQPTEVNSMSENNHSPNNILEQITATQHLKAVQKIAKQYGYRQIRLVHSKNTIEQGVVIIPIPEDTFSSDQYCNNPVYGMEGAATNSSSSKNRL